MTPQAANRALARRRPVLVTWRDATTRTPGWESPEHALSLTPSVVKTVGFVLKRTRREILLAQSVSDDGDVMGGIVIPRDWVQKVERL